MSTGVRTLADLSRTILLVGAGKMGGAMLEGWLRLGLDPKNLAVLEPKPSRELSALAGRGLRLNPAASAVGDASAIIIAVKPQSAAEVMPSLTGAVGAGTVVVSIMAGQRLAFLEQTLSQRAALVRAMPNTPAAIGRGITVAVANLRVSARQRELVHALLSATGAVEWIADEALMVFREAKRQGVQHMIATQAFDLSGKMTGEQMQEAAKLGALIEFDFRNTLENGRTDAIRKVGPQYSFISEFWTKLSSPRVYGGAEGVVAFAEAMRARGFTDRELDVMFKENPAKALGLPVTAENRI